MSTTTAALGDGPVVIYTAAQQQVEVPLSALAFSGSSVAVLAPYDAYSAILAPWLSYLVSIKRLRPGVAPPVLPALLLTAADLGSEGNNIQVGITYPDPAAPTTFNVTASETETYSGLTPATLKSVLGTATTLGQRPGLVRVVDGSFTMPGDLPAKKLGSSGGGTDGNSTTKATLPVPGASGTAFTLEAKKIGADGNLIQATVTITGSTFTLTVTWTKTVSGITAADLTTLDTKLAPLAYAVTVTKPPSGFAQPQAGTVTLSGGVDPATASQSVVASS